MGSLPIQPRPASDLTRRLFGLTLSRRIVVMTMILLGALHIANAGLVYHFYHANAAREREAREAKATLLAEHASRAMAAVDLSLETIVEKVQADPKLGKPSILIQMLIDRHARRLPQVRAIAILDRDGMLVHDSRQFPARPIDLSDRPAFSEQQKWRGVGLYIDRTRLARSDGMPFFGMSRPILDSDGDFLGVVSALVEPAYFSSFYGSQERDLGEDAVLARNDGALLSWAADSGAPSSLEESVGDFLARKHAATAITRPVPSFPLEIVLAARPPMASPAFQAFLAADLAVMAAIMLIALLLMRVLEREAAAREAAESRLRDAIESAPAGFALFDAKDRLILSNELYRSFFSRIRHLIQPHAKFTHLVRAAATHRVYELPSPETLQGFIQQRLAQHRAAAGEIVEQLADGRWILTRERPTREGGVLCFHTDITQLKRQEEALRRSEQSERAARERAEQADRAKSQFLATMSHELRTPLNAVIGFAEIIEQAIFGPLNAKYLEFGGFIRKSGQHLLAIINGILDIAKLQSGKTELHCEATDVAEIIQDAVELVAKQAEAAKLRLTARILDALPPISADPIRLRQVLLNLCSNAIKFTLEGGEVAIEARRWQDGIRIDVVDTGIGMAHDDIPKALLPFTQITNAMTRKHEGTGLGLPVSKALVELHGGELAIASAPDRGTTVTIFLPERLVIAEAAALPISKSLAD